MYSNIKRLFGFWKIARNVLGSSWNICCYLGLTYIILLIAETSLFSLLNTRVRMVLFLWFMASCHLLHKFYFKENKMAFRLLTSVVYRFLIFKENLDKISAIKHALHKARMHIYTSWISILTNGAASEISWRKWSLKNILCILFPGNSAGFWQELQKTL